MITRDRNLGKGFSPAVAFGFLLLVPSLVTYRCYWRLKHIVRDRTALAQCAHRIGRSPTAENTLGGDFKRYLLENNIPERLKELKSGLDGASSAIIDRDLEFILNYPNRRSVFAENFLCENQENLMLPKEIEILRHEQAVLKVLRAKGAIGGSESLVYEHGLKALPQSVKDYIKGKSFIDAGAWIGDSALVLRKYQPSKIYSFEISQKSLPQLRQNTANDKGLIEIIPYALSSQEGYLSYDDMGGEGNSLFYSGDNRVKTITLDSFFESGNRGKLGYIKADIEGAEMDMLRGAKNIITRDRPVLVFCIYHNPEQFFEMKPMLESWGLNYKFLIRKQMGGPHIVETTLIAYPQELDE
ncbi:MAG: FkbM family methyltransferase [Puniceicoccales bacterium]|jgi:FkbM family methyltransferase|nr:FkbM family methyltransferase [Puniceicoccales bacterium]